MLCESAVEREAAPTWAPTGKKRVDTDWRTVDRALRSVAKRRAVLDADEARWIREAEALQIWRPLGMVSMLDYLERVLGYAPRKAQERLRVARALGSLPQLTDALASGELAFSAVRELPRVVTPATEGAWIASVRGTNLREIEGKVAHRKPGDNPDDPPDPKPRRHVVRFELSPETFALLRQTRAALNEEHTHNLDDDQFVKAMCDAVLDGASTTAPTGRAKHQIALTVCERCRTGWQEGAGAQIVVGPEVVERAMCDAQHIGSIDGDGPERAHQDIPPSVARFVWRRDGGRCRVPGCRSARGLELHHIVHRIDGGSHDASNIVLCCSACHQSHHAGVLAISGTAAQLEVRRPAASADGMEAGIRPRAGADLDAHSARTASYRPDDDGIRTECVLHAERDVRTVSRTPTDDDVRSEPEVCAESQAHVGARTPCRPGGDGTCIDSVFHAEPGACVASRRPDELRVRVETVPSRLESAVLRTQAEQALVGLGWKPAIAAPAVAAAAAALGAEATLEQLIFEALRRCPRPMS